VLLPDHLAQRVVAVVGKKEQPPASMRAKCWGSQAHPNLFGLPLSRWAWIR
jgi:hypothetical protein